MPRIRRNSGKTITQIDNQFMRLRNNILSARNAAPKGSERRTQLNERGRRLDDTYVRYSNNIGRALSQSNIGYNMSSRYRNGLAGVIIDRNNTNTPSVGRELSTISGRRDAYRAGAPAYGLRGYWEFPRSTYMGISRGSVAK